MHRLLVDIEKDIFLKIIEKSNSGYNENGKRIAYKAIINNALRECLLNEKESKRKKLAISK